ncbi:MAG: LTA synthase family protein [Streptococcaceae bacterium]|jgi:lipoteichoic acid synthase|nr:LTA synthase family protein [Streptococcaceae bacterium]
MFLLVVLFWLKSVCAYLFNFDLNIESTFQYFFLLINPIATTIFLLGLTLYLKRPLASYITMGTVYCLLTLLLFSNVSYYREFSDFLTVATILGSKSVSAGLGEAAINLFRPYDLFFFIDLIVIPLLFFTKKIHIDQRSFRLRVSFAISTISCMLFGANLSFAEVARPELLKRMFSNDYIIKYMGISFFTVYDSYRFFKTDQVRSEASPKDLDKVKDYVREHYAAYDSNLFGIAKGRNVITIHLESFQQFLINYKLKDDQEVEHEVTPFLNEIFRSKETFSFDNFFHQVAQGKTSDAENLLESSLFGLESGSLFTQYGEENTFQAAPSILQQKLGMTSAVFHGNGGGFWNRNETYKQLGYDYFFHDKYFKINEKNSFQYGLHDKELFKQSIKYLEHLQQPFYVKYITVSNHFPYGKFHGEEDGFPFAQTNDKTINGYFATTNYLDTAIKELFDYLKASGLYDDSMIIIYGDHYGISNKRNPNLASLLDKDPEIWNDYDNAMLQRVPLMFHVPKTDIPGRTEEKGADYINHTFGGEVDVLPTLLHLLGVETKQYLQLGQDLLSPNRDQVVSFRNKSFITPDYTVLDSKIYITQGEQAGALVENPTAETENTIDQLRQKVNNQLAVSDLITTKDLLRFYGQDESGLVPVNPEKYSYKNEFEHLKKIEKQKKQDSTSLYSKNDKHSTVKLYKTKSYQDYQDEKESLLQANPESEADSNTFEQ